MSDDTQQAVVESGSDAAKPASSTDDARETGDLATLLKEFTQAVPSNAGGAPASTPEPTGSSGEPDVKELLTKIERREQERETREKNDAFAQKMQTAVDTIRGDLPADTFDDIFVEAWLETQARKNPDLVTAWGLGDQNPAAFEKVLKTLGEDFNKFAKARPDANVTEDVNAVASAVRGASTEAPAGRAHNFGAMPQGEFEKLVNSLPRHAS